MDNKVEDPEWDNFIKLLEEIKLGKGTGPFAPIETTNDPKSWNELIDRNMELEDTYTDLTPFKVEEK